MSEKLEVLKQDVKKSGHFNFSDLYEFCFLWFKDEGFKLAEKKYVEKDSGAKEIQLEWEAKKKVSDYFMFHIKVKWHIIGMTEETIERAGKQEKTNKGDLKMTITATLVTDYEGRWEDKAFNKFLRAIYDKYIIKTRSDQQEIKLESKTNSLISDIKGFLELGAK